MALRRVSLSYHNSSERYFERVRDLGWPVWLDSGKPQQQRGRYDIISAAPSHRIGLHNNQLSLNGQAVSQNLWALLRTLLNNPSSDSAPDLPFSGGIIGYFGYDLGRRTEALDDRIPVDFDLPEAQLGLYQWAILQDHDRRQATLVAQESLPEQDFEHLKNRVQDDLLNSSPAAKPKAESSTDEKPPAEKGNTTVPTRFEIGSIAANTSKKDYLKAVARIKDYILAGDCYQVNFAQRFDIPYRGDVYCAYQAMRQVLPSQYSGFFESDDLTLLSLSPECFLTSDKHGRVVTKPIKGTIPRGETPTEDRSQAEALLGSAKDRAENLMIVDLLRNDLSKSCAPNTVETTKLFDLESYANVHHLVSTVCGQLSEGIDSISLAQHCFPGGSITGAPKIRAMEIIEELEKSRRSAYCGSLGYIGFDGAMDLNIAIRSLVASDTTLYCWGGGGIVADSDPEQEYEESLNKIGVLLETLKNQFQPEYKATT